MCLFSFAARFAFLKETRTVYTGVVFGSDGKQKDLTKINFTPVCFEVKSKQISSPSSSTRQDINGEKFY